MRRKTLYTLALLLFLSTVALSNERTRFRCRTSGNVPCSVKTATAAATTPATASASVSDDHLFLHTFIKLLYI